MAGIWPVESLFGGCHLDREGFAGRVEKHGEGRTLARLRGDGELATMAIEDVLDDCKPEPGPPFLPARRHVDAVEAFGETRQMLGRDTRSLVDYRDCIAAWLPPYRWSLSALEPDLPALDAVA